MRLFAKSTRQKLNNKKQNKVKVKSPTVIGRGLVAFGAGNVTRPSAAAYALHTIRLATQFLAKFGTRQSLFTKNSSLNCFLNVQTLACSSHLL